MDGFPAAHNFFVSNTLWNPTFSSTLSLGNALTDNAQVPGNTLIFIPGSSGSNSLFFTVSIPKGQVANSYTQNIILLNAC